MKKKLKQSKEIDDIQFKKDGLAAEIQELSGQNLYGCYQCGTCSAGCPFIDDMDLGPDEVIRFAVLNKNEVLQANSIWICASCFACAERCPRDINITKVMEAMRQIILRKKIDKTKIKNISQKEKERIPQIAFVSLFRKNVG